MVQAANADDGWEQWGRVLADLWQAQSSYSQKADALKAGRTSSTGPLVALSFGGVVIGMLSPLIHDWNEALSGPGWIPKAVGVLGAFLAGASTFLASELLGPKQVKDWVAARLIAETLKAEGYRYSARTFPYHDADAPVLLAKKIAELTGNGQNFGPLPPADKDVGKKHPHGPIDAGEYIELRVKGQIKKHEEDAKEYADRLEFWRRVSMGLGLISVAIGSIGSIVGEDKITVWMAVVTTAIATVTAYVLGARLEFLASSYDETAQRLRNRITLWNAIRIRDATARNGLVVDCESILAAQNQAWAGELTKKGLASIQNAADKPGQGLPAVEPEVPRRQ